MEELQMNEATRARWIFYSALDAKATWELYHSLQVGCHLQLHAGTNRWPSNVTHCNDPCIALH
jgi:hypothetical protein